MSISAHPSTSVQQPHWHPPAESTNAPELRLYNSLTRQKEIFRTADGTKRVSWYSCGPTVYDAAHMGHARSYVTFDILRRVMEDYFGYRVLYVMNITDIDDKIILRARQNYLFQDYRKVQSTQPLSAALVQEIRQAWSLYAVKQLLMPAQSLLRADNQPLKNPFAEFHSIEELVLEKHADFQNAIGEKFPMIWSTLKHIHQAISEADLQLKNAEPVPSTSLIDISQDVLMPVLDAEKGNSVQDHAIFQSLSSHWEREFMVDMKALNVRPPDVLTRVSEYVPEIVHFVETIIKNGYGYESDGSVYFDVQAFKSKHDYAKLAPWSAGHSRLLAEGEGSLGANLKGKRSPFDFALWKGSKPGEPYWDSPWGRGRPGWHIECSAMACDVAGSSLDIHSGGIDLCFPHHDNELAQTEAFYGHQQWVNYFLHAGHLHIEGQKMSKSLKNFITIKEALANCTASQLRLMFLRYSWEAVLDYKDSALQEAAITESTFKNFFDTVKALKREALLSPRSDPPSHDFRDAEKSLLKSLEESQEKVHVALCENINTPLVLQELLGLVSKTNVYIKHKTTSGKFSNVDILQRVAKYVTGMLKIFGVIPTGTEEIGFSATAQSTNSSMEEQLLPYLDAIATFRDNVRELARAKKEYKTFFEASDDLRDRVLPALGVVLEDREGSKPMIKLASQDEILVEKQRRMQLEESKKEKKAELAALQESKRREKLEKGRTPPQKLWTDDPSFSRRDEQGIPTHDDKGVELSKSRRKKLAKDYETQSKLHQEFLEAKAKGDFE